MTPCYPGKVAPDVETAPSVARRKGHWPALYKTRMGRTQRWLCSTECIDFQPERYCRRKHAAASDSTYEDFYLRGTAFPLTPQATIHSTW